MSEDKSKITMNPVNGTVFVDGEPLTPEQHKELWDAMAIEISKEIDKQIIENIKNNTPGKGFL